MPPDNVTSIASGSPSAQSGSAQRAQKKRRSALVPVTKKVRLQMLAAWLEGSPEECIADTIEVKRPIVEIVLREELLERYPFLARNAKARKAA